MLKNFGMTKIAKNLIKVKITEIDSCMPV